MTLYIIRRKVDKLNNQEAPQIAIQDSNIKTNESVQEPILTTH